MARSFAWHTKRFRRRIEREFANKWQEYDALYVHGDAALASAVSQHRPTVLRLPGPLTAERAPLLRSVHAVCANGDALVRVRTFLGDHAVELPVGLDTHAFTPGRSEIRRRLRWTDHHCVIGYVGRLAFLKGVDLLAAAFREVVRSKPLARLLLVGSGEQDSSIRTLLAEEFANGSVHIERGVNHDELPDWYRAMDLFVMPSRYENHSNARFEAMACGVPFLASNVGGNRRLSETGAGVLFDTESITSLAGTLSRLIANRRELSTLAANSLRAVHDSNTWAVSAERLESILSSRLKVK